MKKFLLFLVALLSVNLSVSAADRMNVNTEKGTLGRFLVDDVEKVYYQDLDVVDEDDKSIRDLGFDYQEGDTTATLRGISNYHEEVNFVIPTYVKLDKKIYTVIGIDNNAFEESKVESIIIPSSVTSIGDFAFEYCESLTSVEIPSSVTYIGLATFSDCVELSSPIRIPDGVTTIDYSTFRNCIKLPRVEIPSSVTSIEEWAFAGCASLTELEIPSSVTYISKGAFSQCSELSSSIKMPDGLTSIGDYMFTECFKLPSVEIPSSVTSIGEYAFTGCASLTELEISSNVTSIGKGAFEDCENLNIVINNTEDNVTIGKDAFNGCKSVVFRNPNGYEYVDLGLSSKTMWAAANLGAEKSTEYGKYYAWGELSTKTAYTSESAIHYGKDEDALKADGVIDDSNNLTAEYDIATKTCGKGWSIPTKADFDELIKECKWEQTTVGGVEGYKVSSKVEGNNNYIFLPMSGYFSSSVLSQGSLGNYWTSTAEPSNYAYALALLKASYKTQTYNIDGGRSIRPVYKK